MQSVKSSRYESQSSMPCRFGGPVTKNGFASGYKPAPGIKLAINSEMYQRMSEDMDINYGDMISHGVTLEQKGQEIFDLFIRISSGEMTKSEELGFGGAEFVPWQMGAVMKHQKAT